VNDLNEAVPSHKSLGVGSQYLRGLLARPDPSVVGDVVVVEAAECPTCILGRAASFMLDPSLCGFIVVCVEDVYLNPSLSSLHLVLHLVAPLVLELRGIEWRRRCMRAQSQHCLRPGRRA
jgi:hypothetical protein